MLREIRVLVIAVSLLMAAGLGPGRAQTPSPLSEWQYSSGVLLEPLFIGRPEGWRLLAGPAAQWQPLYDGARKYTIEPGIAFDLRYDQFFFFSMGEGLGVNAICGPNYRIGLALGYDLGRREKDDRANLHGMGDIPDDPVAKIFAMYAVSKAFPLTLRADVQYFLLNHRGFAGDLGAYLPLPGSNENLVIFFGPSVTLADQRNMQTLFGVTARQALTSGRPHFHPQAGVKSAGAGFALEWFFVPDRWLMDLHLGYARLLGDAAQSPITRNADGASVSVAVIYKF